MGQITGDQPVSDEIRQAIRQLLEEHSTITLATTDGERLWATAVFFASDMELNLYFVSDRRTRHGRNLAANARVAGAISANCTTWSEIRGLQLEGNVTVLEELARLSALKIYLAKFPDVSSLMERPRDKNEKTIATRLREARIYRLSPEWIRLIDNSKGFGYKEEVTLHDTRTEDESLV